MMKHVKCIVHGCPNHQYEGGFEGALCRPCYTMLTTGVVAFGETFIHRLRDSWMNDVGKIMAQVRANESVLKDTSARLDKGRIVKK